MLRTFLEARRSPRSAQTQRVEPDPYALTDAQDFPPDEDIPKDGDDADAFIGSHVKFGSEAHESRIPPSRLGPHFTLVELPRELKLGMRGRDVIAVQRALRHAGFRDKPPTGMYGPGTRKAVRKFQEKHHLHPDGEYGPETHREMVRWHHFDDYGEWLLAHTKVGPTKAQVAQRTMRATGFYVVNRRGAIHYTQGPMRMQGVRQKLHPPQYPRWEDCSSMATWFTYVAGVPDPNGLGYDGFGYTGTQILHGVEVTRSDAKVGDLVFYGRARNAISHVAMYVGNGMVVSHGSEGGPYYIPIRYRTDMQMIRRYIIGAQ